MSVPPGPPSPSTTPFHRGALGVSRRRSFLQRTLRRSPHRSRLAQDHGNYELYDEETLGPFPEDWHARQGRVVLTGEYGGKAGFRHVMNGLGIEPADDDLAFRLVQLCNAQTGRPLTDDELRLIGGYPNELALLFPGQLG